MAIRHHRKLLTDDSTNATLSELCEIPCDPMNESGFCISPCLSHCPDVCRYNFADLIPPTQNSTLPDYSWPPPPTSHHLSPLLMTTFVALALTIVLIGCYLIFVRYFNRGRTRRRSIAQPQQTAPPPDDEEFFDQGPVLDHPIWYIRTLGLQPSVISKITICKYKRDDGLVEGTECSVCLSEFEEDESLRLLPKCSHAFHISCIDTWLRSHTNCPNCRAPIVTNVARSPSPESSADNSMTWEEIRLDDSNSGGGMSSGIDNDPRSMGETEVETEESNGNGTGSGNGSIAEEVKTDMQLLRRSVSVDSLSAAKISQAVADFLAGKSDRKSNSNLDSEENQDQEMGIVPKRSSEGGADNGSSSIGSSSSMKRSLSLSGRFSLSKYSRGRSRSLVLPL